MFEWDRNAPERRSGPFKKIRLMIKLHQAYILGPCQIKHFQTKNAPNVVWRQGSARTRWVSLQRSPDPLAALKLLAHSALEPRRLRRLASRLRRSETKRSDSFFPIRTLVLIDEVA